MIHVYLIDDHPLILKSVEAILSEKQNMVVVGKSCQYNSETLNDIKQKKTDVLILDVSMPEKDAFEITPIIRKELPDLKIIIYTMHAIYRYFKHFYNLKIEGFIIKSSETADLITGINDVYQGLYYYPDHILKQIQSSNEKMELNQIQFTHFESMLLENLKKNFTNKELAAIMNCSLQKILEARKKLLVKTNSINMESLLKSFYS